MSRLSPVLVAILVALVMAVPSASAAPPQPGALSGSTVSKAKPAPPVIAKKVRKLARVSKRRVRRHRGIRAHVAGWYDYSRIYANAHCFGTWLNVNEPLVKALAGYRTQWVAIKADYTNGSVWSLSDWYQGIATSWGEWVGLSGGGRFVNARTGQHVDAPGFLHSLLPGNSNVRMSVVWYSGSTVQRQYTFWFNRDDYSNCY